MGGHIRTAIIGAAVGAGLALILGLFSGASFDAVLLRLLLSSALTAGIFVSISLVSKRFLAVDGDDPLASDEDDGTMDQGQSMAMDPENGTMVDVAVSGDEGELEGVYGTTTSTVPMVQEVEEVASTMEPQPSVASSEAFTQGVDHLPDIGGYADTFGSAPPVENDNPESGFGSAGPTSSGGVGGGGSALDPELIAKAISTKLKREGS